VVFAILSHKMSQQKHPKPVLGIVTSDSVHNRRFITTKFGIIGLVILIVIIAVVGVFLVVHFSINSSNKSQTSANTTKKQQNIKTISPLQALNNAQNELKNADTNQQKAAAYNNLGSAYMSNNNVPAAITAYQTAITTDSSTETTSLIGLGYAYYMNGQDSQSISSFQKLVSLLQASSDQYEQGKASQYQVMIQLLQEGKSI